MKNACKYVFMALLVTCCILQVSAQSSSSLTGTNLVVDFDSTTFDSNLGPGDSGILNLVIENTGGRRAEEVEIQIPSTGTVYADRKFFIGGMEPTQSKIAKQAHRTIKIVDGKIV